MKVEEQVCGLELSKKLKGLGVKQDSLFCWYTMRNDVDHQDQGEPFVDFKYCSDSHFDPDGTSYYHPFEIASAFTVAELGEMLPDGFYTTKKGCFWLSWHDEEGLFGVDGNYISDCTEADARAKMLIRLVECGRVKP
jgi:hypothetical protein